MFIAIYEFRVKKGREESFRKAWAKVTDSIVSKRGSLGSRLHVTGDGRYVAYAQWPSREIFDQGPSKNLFDESELDARQTMQESCDEIKTVYQLVVCDDRLKSGATASVTSEAGESAHV